MLQFGIGIASSEIGMLLELSFNEQQLFTKNVLNQARSFTLERAAHLLEELETAALQVAADIYEVPLPETKNEAPAEADIPALAETAEPEPFMPTVSARQRKKQMDRARRHELDNEAKVFVAPEPDMSGSQLLETFLPEQNATAQSKECIKIAKQIVNADYLRAACDNSARTLAFLLCVQPVLQQELSETDFKQLNKWVDRAQSVYLKATRPYFHKLLLNVEKDGGSLAMEDLINEAQIGFLEALLRFDLSTTEHKVRSFCTRRAYGEAQDALRRNGSVIKHSRRYLQIHKKALDAQQAHPGKTLVEVADEIGESQKTIEDAKLYVKRTSARSLEESVGPTGKSLKLRLEDRISDENVDVEAEALAGVSEHAALLEAYFKGLPDRTAKVMRMRFGFPPYAEECKYLEIAEELGVTESRVCQIVNRELEKLGGVMKTLDTV
jgi:RNA polymerase sigma factor (sigma-70 family)